jgi:phospholipase C
MKMRSVLSPVLAMCLLTGPASSSFAADPSWHISPDEHDMQRPEGIDKIETVVVIYGENRSFDNLYGYFPGANGIDNAAPVSKLQIDRDGTPLPTLPKIWGGLLPAGTPTPPQIPEASTANLPNGPFGIDNPKIFNTPMSVTTRDLVHRFYQNQMQINGGKNNIISTPPPSCPCGNMPRNTFWRTISFLALSAVLS